MNINGVDLFVTRFGDPGLPPLVVIHGGPTWDHSYLLPAVSDLSDIAHVVLFDLDNPREWSAALRRFLG